MGQSKRYTLLRKILKALGLNKSEIDALVIRVHFLWTGKETHSKQAFPYHLKKLLTPAELNFYRVLQTAVSDWAIIFAKVRLGDLFYPKADNRSENTSYRNKIQLKHVDFLLCDPQTLKPMVAIELDDKSHQRKDRRERDEFVDGVFDAAGLPLLHVPAKIGYQIAKLNTLLQEKAGRGVVEVKRVREETAVSLCPKCSSPMILRTAKKGANAGNQFWGCSTYPKCRGILSLKPAQF